MSGRETRGESAREPSTTTPYETLLALAVSLSAATALGQTTKPAADLIPRDVLFGNPDHAAVKISPDGRHLSYAAPVDGVLNLWVAPTDHPDQAKAITRDTGRGVTQYFWAYDNAHLVYLQDKNGNENFDLYSVDLADGTTKPLYENPQVRVEIDGTSEKFPGKILIGLNDRVAPFHDLYEIDVATGEKKPVLQNPGTIDGNYVAGFAADDDFRVRFALAFASDGGMVVYEKEKGGDDKQSPATTRAGDWKEWRKIDFQDTLSTAPVGFADDGRTLYMTDSAGRDTAALYAIDLQTGDKKCSPPTTNPTPATPSFSRGPRRCRRSRSTTRRRTGPCWTTRSGRTWSGSKSSPPAASGA